MMGLPSMGSDEESSPSQQPEQDQSKQTLWGMPALKEDGSAADGEEVAKTEVVSADELPFAAADFDFGEEDEEDDATREVQIDTIADALGAAKEPEEEMPKRSKAKETAFGLPAISNEESEPTQVDSPKVDSPKGHPPSAKETAFGLPAISDGESEPGSRQQKQAKETQEREVEAAWGLAGDSVSDDGDATEIVSAADIQARDEATQELEKERGENQFGTLMGMNVPENFNNDGAGAMHRGSSEDEEEEGDAAATAALSAEKLAQFEEMGFPVGDDAETDWSSDGIDGGAGSAHQDDDVGDKTAVLDPGAAGFQLPKPRQKKEEEDDTLERTLDKKDEKQARKKPQSGVFRSAGPSRDSNPGKGERGGVGGTGTYQMSNTERTNTGQTGAEQLRDEDLSIGAVGSSKTSFPTAGAKEDEKGSSANKRAGASTESTGPRFAIGDTGSKSSRPRNMTPESSPAMASPEKPEEVVPEPIEEPASPVGVLKGGGEAKAPKQRAPKQEERKPKKRTPKQREAKQREAKKREPRKREPKKGSPQSGGFGAEPAGQAKSPKTDSGFGAQPAGPSTGPQTGGGFGAERASQSTGPQTGGGFGAERASQSPGPQGGGGFGAEPASQSPGPQRGGFGAEPAGQSPGPQGGPPSAAPATTTAPGASAASQDQGEPSPAKTSGGVEGMIAMIQRGFGIMASLAMMGVVAAAVATEGLPEAFADLALMGLAVLMGVVAVVAVALMADTKRRSMVMGLLAMMILVGFLAALLAEASLLLALGLCAGALLLFFGAIFAAVGNWIGASAGQ